MSNQTDARDLIALSHFNACQLIENNTIDIVDTSGVAITNGSGLTALVRGMNQREVNKYAGMLNVVVDKVFEVSRQGSFLPNVLRPSKHAVVWGATFTILQMEWDDSGPLSGSIDDSAVIVLYGKRQGIGVGEIPGANVGI